MSFKKKKELAEKRCSEQAEVAWNVVKEMEEEIENLRENNVLLTEKVSFKYGQFIHNKTINLTKSVIRACGREGLERSRSSGSRQMIYSQLDRNERN